MFPVKITACLLLKGNDTVFPLESNKGHPSPGMNNDRTLPVPQI